MNHIFTNDEQAEIKLVCVSLTIEMIILLEFVYLFTRNSFFNLLLLKYLFYLNIVFKMLWGWCADFQKVWILGSRIADIISEKSEQFWLTQGIYALNYA